MTRQDPGTANGTGVYPTARRCACGCMETVHTIPDGGKKRAGCSNSNCGCTRYSTGEAK